MWSTVYDFPHIIPAKFGSICSSSFRICPYASMLTYAASFSLYISPDHYNIFGESVSLIIAIKFVRFAFVVSEENYIWKLTNQNQKLPLVDRKEMRNFIQHRSFRGDYKDVKNWWSLTFWSHSIDKKHLGVIAWSSTMKHIVHTTKQAISSR